MMHVPLRAYGGALIDNAGDLFEVLRDRPRVLALSGHTHDNVFNRFGPEDGWNGEGSFEELVHATVCGAWWSGPRDHRGIPSAHQWDGSPNGWTHLHIDGTDYAWTFHAFGRDRDHQMRLYPPGRGETEVVANVFYGTSDWKVAWTVDGQSWTPMTQRPGLDPLAAQLYAQPAHLGKPWVKARETPHLWAADLPADLPEGMHTLRVRATDPRGRVYEAARLLSR